MPLKSFVCVLRSKGTLIAGITKSISHKNTKQGIFVYIIYPFDKKNVTLPNNMPEWWNWQTRTSQKRVPKGVRVRVPSSAQ